MSAAQWDSDDEEETVKAAHELYNEAWDALDEEKTNALPWSTVVVILRLLGIGEDIVATICPEEVLQDKTAQIIRIGIQIRKLREELELVHPSLKSEARKRIKAKEEEVAQVELRRAASQEEADLEVTAEELVFVTREQIRDDLFEIVESPDGSLSDDETKYALKEGIVFDSKLPTCQEVPRGGLSCCNAGQLDIELSVQCVIFGVFDTDGDGVITREDLGLVLAALGERSTRLCDGNNDELINTMLEQFDENNDGQISFIELSKYLGTDAGTSAAGKLQHHINALKDLFSLIDVDGDNTFSLFELSDAMSMFGIEVDKEELLEEFEKAGGKFDDCGEEYDNDMLCFMRMVIDKPCANVVKFVEGLRDCNELFSIFDDDGGGSISVVELSDTMTALFRRRPTQFEMKKLIETVDDDGSGIIEFSEFVHMMYGTHTAKSVVKTLNAIKIPIKEQHQLFRIFCTNNVSNFACREFGILEFKQLMCCLAHPYSDDDLQQMMNEIDTSGQGTIDFGEFAKMMTGQIKSDTAKKEINRQFGDLRKLFEFFDDDGSGCISVDELRVIVEGIGKHPTDEEFVELVKTVDYTGDGEIGFDEFVAMLASDATSTQVFMHVQIQEFRDAYKLFDVDGDQSVSRIEFQRVMGLFGESCLEDAEMLLDLVDEDGDGEIDFIEFLSFMVSKNPILQRGLRAPIVSFREMFNMFDEDKGGTIDVTEFMVMIDSLGMEMTEEEVKQMMFKGYPGAEELDFAMFVELVASARTTTGGGGVLNRISELQESFTMFDEDGSGALDAEEIKAVLGKLGQEVTIEEVNKIVSAVDSDNDGEINFCEFIKLISKQEPDEEQRDKKKELETPAHDRIMSKLTRPEPEDDDMDDDKRLDDETSENVLGLLRDTLKIIKLKPTEKHLWAKRRPVYKQGKAMTDFNIVLSGRVHVFEGSSAPKEPTKYQLDRHRTNALWCQLGPLMRELFILFRGVLVQFPVEDDNYKFSDATKQMISDLKYLSKDIFGWHSQGKNSMSCDLDTALASESLIEQGADIYRAFVGLLPVLDSVRKGHIALRTKIQLMSAGGCDGMDAEDVGMSKIEVVIQLSKDLMSKISEANHKMHSCFAPLDEKRPSNEDDGERTLDEESLRELERSNGRLVAVLREGECFGEGSFATGKEITWPVTLFTIFPALDSKDGTIILGRATRQQWQQALLDGPFSFLSNLHIFNNLILSEIKQIASVMTEVSVPLHVPIQKLGEPAEKVPQQQTLDSSLCHLQVFFVKSGTLKVMQALPGQVSGQRRRKSLALLGAGDMVNECNKSSDSSVCLYSAEVVADSKDVVVYSMPRHVFLSNPRIQHNAVMLTSWREELRSKQLSQSSCLVLPVFDGANPRPVRLPKMQPGTQYMSPTSSPPNVTQSATASSSSGGLGVGSPHSFAPENRTSVSLSQSRPGTSSLLTWPSMPPGTLSSMPPSRPGTSFSSSRPGSSMSPSRPSTSFSSTQPTVGTPLSALGRASMGTRPSTSHGCSQSLQTWPEASPRSLFEACVKRGRKAGGHEVARKTAPRSHNAKNLSFEYVGGKDRLDAISNLMAREQMRCSSAVGGLAQHSSLQQQDKGSSAPASTEVKFSYHRVSRSCSVMQPPPHIAPPKVSKIYTIEHPRRSNVSGKQPPTIYNFEVNNQTLCELRPTRKHGFIQ